MLMKRRMSAEQWKNASEAAAARGLRQRPLPAAERYAVTTSVLGPVLGRAEIFTNSSGRWVIFDITDGPAT